jgi:hypothetical protein
VNPARSWRMCRMPLDTSTRRRSISTRSRADSANESNGYLPFATVRGASNADVYVTHRE